MKIPFSKEIIYYLISPFLAFTGVGLFDLLFGDGKRVDQSVALVIFFGLPSIILVWLTLSKKFDFKKNMKVSKKESLIQLPFSELYLVFFLSGLLFLGVILIFDPIDKTYAIPLVSTSLFFLLLAFIAIDHPKIWFSNTLDIEALIEKVKNVPRENIEESVFSYTEDSFTIQLEKRLLTIKWEEILFVRSYKVDQVTVDLIIIEICTKDFTFKIHEEMPGFVNFMDIASGKLVNFRKDWFKTVAFPAFKENLTVIYEKYNGMKYKRKI